MGFSKFVQVLTAALTLMPEFWRDPAVRHALAVSLGAVGGALSRYYLSLWFARHFGVAFPYGTLLINLSGCFCLGFLFGLTLGRATGIAPEVQLLVAVGFLGSYTTFSTYALDTANLLRTGTWRASLFYWAGSAVLGVLSLELGRLLAGWLPK